MKNSGSDESDATSNRASVRDRTSRGDGDASISASSRTDPVDLSASRIDSEETKFEGSRNHLDGGGEDAISGTGSHRSGNRPAIPTAFGRNTNDIRGFRGIVGERDTQSHIILDVRIRRPSFPSDRTDIFGVIIAIDRNRGISEVRGRGFVSPERGGDNLASAVLHSAEIGRASCRE